MEYFYRICLEFTHGIKDSLNIKKVVEFVLISNTIKTLLVRTFLINGVLIVGSTFVLRIISNSSIVLSMNHSQLAQTLFSIIYHVVYLYPLLAISFIVNSFWYMDMASDALNIERQLFRNRGVNPANPDVVTRIYNEVINGLVLLFFIIQSVVISFIPYFGPTFYLIMQSFTYAFYCFAYKWGTDQVDIHKILAFFDKYFFYFSGFGFVFACITRVFPGLMGSGVYATLFPVFLLLSIKASPPKDLQINSLTQFLQHLRLLFARKKKQETSGIDYDYIDTFNYEETKVVSRNKIGIFTFPLVGIDFVATYLNNKFRI